LERSRVRFPYAFLRLLFDLRSEVGHSACATSRL
jgi:hypothetical protein